MRVEGMTAAGEKLSESTASDVRQLCSTLLNCYLVQVLTAVLKWQQFPPYCCLLSCGHDSDPHSLDVRSSQLGS